MCWPDWYTNLSGKKRTRYDNPRLTPQTRQPRGSYEATQVTRCVIVHREIDNRRYIWYDGRIDAHVMNAGQLSHTLADTRRHSPSFVFAPDLTAMHPIFEYCVGYRMPSYLSRHLSYLVHIQRASLNGSLRSRPK